MTEERKRRLEELRRKRKKLEEITNKSEPKIKRNNIVYEKDKYINIKLDKIQDYKIVNFSEEFTSYKKELIHESTQCKLKNEIEMNELEKENNNLMEQLLQKEDENQRLKEILEEKENNYNYNNEINNYKKERENEINKYVTEINRYKNDIQQLKQENNELTKKINTQNYNNNQFISYMDDLKIKEELKKYIPIIFVSVDQKVHCAFICKKTDKFNMIENLLYEKYPEYLETENYFTVNGKKINTKKSIEENNIKYGDIILLNIYDFE